MAKDLYAFISKRIRQEKKKLKLTIEELAACAGISAGFLACIITNKRKPTVDTIGKIAKALNIHVSKLFEDVPMEQISENKKIKSQIEHLINTAKPAHKTVMLSTLKELSKSLNKSKK